MGPPAPGKAGSRPTRRSEVCAQCYSIDFRKKHEFLNILTHARQLQQFIIITIIVPTSHGSATRREKGTPVRSPTSSSCRTCGSSRAERLVTRPSLVFDAYLLPGLDERFEVRPLAQMVQVANPAMPSFWISLTRRSLSRFKAFSENLRQHQFSN
jgi:hypothetical protein